MRFFGPVFRAVPTPNCGRRISVPLAVSDPVLPCCKFLSYTCQENINPSEGSPRSTFITSAAKEIGEHVVFEKKLSELGWKYHAS